MLKNANGCEKNIKEEQEAIRKMSKSIDRNS